MLLRGAVAGRSAPIRSSAFATIADDTRAPEQHADFIV
jgi:hypothetical protein